MQRSVGNRAVVQLLKTGAPRQAPGRVTLPEGGGSPLEAGMRRRMEGDLGADLSTVRLHQSRLPLALGAAAFTRRESVFVAPGFGSEGVIRHELGHVLQQREQVIHPTRSVRGVAINDSPHLERDAERPRKRADAGGRGTATTAGGAAPVQLLRLDRATWQLLDADAVATATTVETGTMTTAERCTLVDDIRMAALEAGNAGGGEATIATLTDDWLDNADFGALTTRLRRTVAVLVRSYAMKWSTAVFQRHINQLAATLTLDITRAVLEQAGVDPAEHAIIMVGSAARGEMFPASDIDLMVLGQTVPGSAIDQAISHQISDLSTKIVEGGYADAGADLVSGARPFKIDTCLGGRLFHTGASVIKEATTRTLSSDNMVMDTLLLNEGDATASALYERLTDNYDQALSEAPQLDQRYIQAGIDPRNPRLAHTEARSLGEGFLAERIVEIKEKIGNAAAQVLSGRGGFQVKTGLLRPPSLLARDYYSWRQTPKPDPKSTVGRLDSFANGPEDSQLSQDTVNKLKDGFTYGTELRMASHKASGGEQDELKLTKSERSTVKRHLIGYLDAINEMIDVAVAHRVRATPGWAREKAHSRTAGKVTQQWLALAESKLPTGQAGLETLAKESEPD